MAGKQYSGHGRVLMGSRHMVAAGHYAAETDAGNYARWRVERAFRARGR
jgi:hypothetical protein